MKKHLKGAGMMALLPLLSALLGCNTGNTYGTVPDIPDPSQTPIVMILPQNAPSIFQNFRLTAKQQGRGENVLEEHLAIDVAAPQGTPVIAAASGTVVRSYFEPMYGNHVAIAHGLDPAGRRIETEYLHLQTRLVSVGEVVRRGQQIGKLGKTGVLASGILHLHFEVFRQSKTSYMQAVDPNLFWAEGPGRVTCFDSARSWQTQPFVTVYPVPCRGIEWQAPVQENKNAVVSEIEVNTLN